MKQYCVDLRERLLGAIDAGLPQVETACLFGVGISSIKRWRAWQEQTGTVHARPRPGPTRRISREAESARVAHVQARSDATLVEHCAAWAAATGVVVSPATKVARLAPCRLAAAKKSLIATEGNEAARTARLSA